jgi:peptidoglycan hydrolase-like protein with peptidoglycan-binding domain
MRRIASAAAAVLVTASGIIGVSLASAPPAAGQASCTNISGFYNTAGISVPVPTIGFNTHQDNCDLGPGNDSVAVQTLQFELDDCYSQNLSQDGIYGPLTEEAVQDAQQALHITADGIYGPVTRSHMSWTNYGLDGCYRLR